MALVLPQDLVALLAQPLVLRNRHPSVLVRLGLGKRGRAKLRLADHGEESVQRHENNIRLESNTYSDTCARLQIEQSHSCNNISTWSCLFFRPC